MKASVFTAEWLEKARLTRGLAFLREPPPPSSPGFGRRPQGVGDGVESLLRKLIDTDYRGDYIAASAAHRRYTVGPVDAGLRSLTLLIWKEKRRRRCSCGRLMTCHDYTEAAVFFEDTMPFVLRNEWSGSRQEYVELMPIRFRSDLL